MRQVIRPLGRTGAWLLPVIAVMASAVGRAGAQQPAVDRFHFDTDAQGFAALAVRAGQPTPDADAVVANTKTDGEFKKGGGALKYSFTPEKGAVKSLIRELTIPEGTQSIRAWLRCSQSTAIMFGIREEGGASYNLSGYLPAYQWVEIVANLDEIPLGENEKDSDGKLSADKVRSLAIVDLVSYAALGGDEAVKLFANFNGRREIWVDELQFSSEKAPRTTGTVQVNGQPAVLVDNFETTTVRWMPVRAEIANGLTIQILPSDVQLKVVSEATQKGAGQPTMLDPDGMGLRFTYSRTAQNAFGLIRNLLAPPVGMNNLRLSTNVNQKSMLVVQVKEKDDSEYQVVIMPDESTGWQNRVFPLGSFTLGDNSKDENNRLDVDQLKELVIFDASAFLGGALPSGDITLDLDAISFTP